MNYSALIFNHKVSLYSQLDSAEVVVREAAVCNNIFKGTRLGRLMYGTEAVHKALQERIKQYELPVCQYLGHVSNISRLILQCVQSQARHGCKNPWMTPAQHHSRSRGTARCALV
jgi:hypothetical protein